MNNEQRQKKLLDLVKQLDIEHEKLMVMLQPIINPSVGKEQKVWSIPEFKCLKSQMESEDKILKNMQEVIGELQSFRG